MFILIFSNPILLIRTKRPDMIHAHFFFVDIVGLSNPTLSTTTQFKKLEVFHSFLHQCETFAKTPRNDMLVLPTGDGVCIGFLKEQEMPILLALQLHKKLREYNQGKIPSEMVQIRIGIHTGNCYVFEDPEKRKNVWGPGVIMARRVMDLGDANHILLTSRVAEDLRELSDEYRIIIKPVQDYIFKHGVKSLIYSAYDQNIGNPIPPKHKTETEIDPKIIEQQNSALYPSIEVTLHLLDPQSMLVHHKRTYMIQNVSELPIEYVLHGIGTDVPKNSLFDLKIKTYDNTRKEMKISSISINQPYNKQFSTKFEQPILKGQKNRSFTLEYEVEEPKHFFENNFALDCNDFTLNFLCKNDVMPQLYEINQETDEKMNNDIPYEKKNHDEQVIFSWNLKNLVKGQTIRLVW